jgi:hypothetical protein
MKKWFVAAAALVIFGIPAAYAATTPSKETPKPTTTAQAQSADDKAAKACKAERKSSGVEAFQKQYGTNRNLRNAFGKCVSGKSKDDKDEKDEKDEDDDKGEKSGGAAKACKAERAAGAEAFAKKYGTNHNLKNAFGKCVSGKSKAKDKKDEKDDD